MTAPHTKINAAGVSLLLSRFFVDSGAKAASAQTGDAAFSWMDGEAGELDGETLADLMGQSLTNASSLEWESAPAGVKLAAIELGSEELLLYLIDPAFILCGIIEAGRADARARVTRAVAAAAPQIREFL